MIIPVKRYGIKTYEVIHHIQFWDNTSVSSFKKNAFTILESDNIFFSEFAEAEYVCPSNPGYINVKWGLMFDTLTIVMISMILFVSLCILIYSFEYMKYDINRTRFFFYLILFIYFMLILIISNNLVQLFIG